MEHIRIKDDSERRRRLALLLTWHTFRQSVARGRPMTLPNLLRLYRRCRADRGLANVNADQSALLRQHYLAQQPFHSARPLPKITHHIHPRNTWR